MLQALADEEDHTEPDPEEVNYKWEQIWKAYYKSSKACYCCYTRSPTKSVKSIVEPLMIGWSQTNRDDFLRTSEAETEAWWAEYLSKILNGPQQEAEADIQEAESDLDVDVEPLEEEEIISTVKSLKSVNAELLKADPELAAPTLQPLFTAIWEGRKIPDNWTKGVIVHIPKNSALNHCNHWGCITLLSIPSEM